MHQVKKYGSLALIISSHFFFTGLVLNAQTLYDIRMLGPIDEEHTKESTKKQKNFPEQLNDAGQVIGKSYRYDGDKINGSSAWIADGTQTIRIGLIDDNHTNALGYQASVVRQLNEAGQVIGGSYGNNSTSAWIADIHGTTKIGFTDYDHTNEQSGYKRSYSLDLNEAGQVIGVSDRRDGGRSAWIADLNGITRIGLIDEEHTKEYWGDQYSDVEQLNETGQAIGYSERHIEKAGDFSWASDGQSAWIADVNETTRIGFWDNVHTNSGNGYQSSDVRQLNEAGQVIGYSYRFENDRNHGRSAWIAEADGTTRKLGLFGEEHTDSDGEQHSGVISLNDIGQVIGYSTRYRQRVYNGYSAWIADDSSITKVGLLDKEHTDSANGYQNSLPILLNETGQVIGLSERFVGDGGDGSSCCYNKNKSNGQSAWIADVSGTKKIGLIEDEYTQDVDGFQYSDVKQLNKAGQVIGHSERFRGNSENGQTAWFYDPGTQQTYELLFSARSTDNFAYSSVSFLSEDGIVLGTYNKFNENDVNLGPHAYMWSMDEGFKDLGEQVNGGLRPNAWARLFSAWSINENGQIAGIGWTKVGSRMAYLLTPITEEQGSKYVFVSSRRYNGNFGGVEGADATCQTLASNAGLPGVYKAWISDDASSPNTRFLTTSNSVTYVLPNETSVAKNYAALTRGNLLHSIDRNEYGNYVGLDKVWTNTKINGDPKFGDTNCNGWNYSGSDESVKGFNGYTDPHDEKKKWVWTSARSTQCGERLRVYCFEQ